MKVLAMLAGLMLGWCVHAEGLSADRLGVVFNSDDPASHRIALLYAEKHAVPTANLVGVHVQSVNVLLPEAFAPMRTELLDRLPTSVQSLVLVWSRPWAVGCMSITTAVAAGFRPSFCEPGCGRTAPNPLFDSNGWLPTDTVGWWPAMLLPSDDEALARLLIERALQASAGKLRGTLYLVRTADSVRNVRAAGYERIQLLLGSRLQVEQLAAPPTHELQEVFGYFTGTAKVEELARIHFVPGALADHLTSTGGILQGGDQTSALEWLRRGASASYGSVSEPCNFVDKFPDINVLYEHYLNGETALEAYWKSVAMIGQGLLIGDPLAQPFTRRPL